MNPGDRIRLTLKALPADVPVAIRLRHVLKGLLRAWGLRCVLVERVEPAQTAATTATTEPRP
jgi:hypothetical protein